MNGGGSWRIARCFCTCLNFFTLFTLKDKTQWIWWVHSEFLVDIHSRKSWIWSNDGTHFIRSHWHKHVGKDVRQGMALRNNPFIERDYTTVRILIKKMNQLQNRSMETARNHRLGPTMGNLFTVTLRWTALLVNLGHKSTNYCNKMQQ